MIRPWGTGSLCSLIPQGRSWSTAAAATQGWTPPVRLVIAAWLSATMCFRRLHRRKEAAHEAPTPQAWARPRASDAAGLVDPPQADCPHVADDSRPHWQQFAGDPLAAAASTTRGATGDIGTDRAGGRDAPGSATPKSGT